MKIQILVTGPNSEGKFVPVSYKSRKKSNSIELDVAEDTLTKIIDNVKREYIHARTGDVTPTEDPLMVDQSFMWEGNIMGFTSPTKLSLQMNATGERVLKRFIFSLDAAIEREEADKDKAFFSYDPFVVEADVPLRFKSDPLIGFIEWRGFKDSLSPTNPLLKGDWLKFRVNSLDYYVNKQKIFYDHDDENAVFFADIAKTKVLQYIKNHDAEMSKVEEPTIEEEDNASI